MHCVWLMAATELALEFAKLRGRLYRPVLAYPPCVVSDQERDRARVMIESTTKQPRSSKMDALLARCNSFRTSPSMHRECGVLDASASELRHLKAVAVKT